MSQPELSSLFQLLPIGAYRSAPDGTLLLANATLLRMNGYASEAEMHQDQRNAARDPYVEPHRRAQFQALLEGSGQVKNFVSEIVRLQAPGTMWVREHAHVVRAADGSVLFYEGTVEDITEELAAKAARQQSQALLFNVLQTIPDHIWLKDPQGVYLTCNEAYAAHLGVTAAAVVGTRDADWVGETTAAHFRKTDQLAMKTGQTVKIEENFISPISPNTTLHEVIKTPMRNAQGETIGVLGVARDIQQRKDTEEVLRDTSEQLELALLSADLGRWDHDLTQEKGYHLDERSCLMLGRDANECEIGRAWGHLIHPDDLTATLHALREHLRGASPTYEVDYRARHMDGRWVWLTSRGKVVQRAPDGVAQRMVGTLMDISERKHSESRLRAAQAELQATLNALPDLLFEFTLDGRFRAVHSQNKTEMILPAEFILNKRVTAVLPKDAAEACLAALQEASASGRSTGKQYSMELSRGTQWFELSVVRKPTEPEEEERFIAIARDVTEQKITEESIQRLAFHDSLTGLPNRRLFTDRLQRAISASSRQQQFGALMFLDLDKFKLLNDTFGHDVGDLMLQEVARRLSQNVRAIDTVARLGGDEFVLLIQSLSANREEARMHAATVGHKILASLNEPYVLNGQTHFSTPSIGVTLFNGDKVAPAELVKEADTAMYEAKSMGRNTLQFSKQKVPVGGMHIAQVAI